MNSRSDRESFKARQWQFRHDAIIEAAQSLMGSRGYNAVSIEDLVMAVGISAPTFYTHFSGKEELGVEVVLRMIRIAQAQLESFAKTLPAAEAANAMIAWTIEQQFGEDNTFEYAGMQMLFDHEKVIAATEELTKELAAHFADAQRSGGARTDVSANFLASTLFSIVKDPAHSIARKRGGIDVRQFRDDVTRLFT